MRRVAVACWLVLGIVLPAGAAEALEPGWAALVDGRDDEALELLDECLGRRPQAIDCALGRAALLEARGLYTEASETLASALLEAPRGPVAAGALARLTALVSRAADGGESARAALEAVEDGRLPVASAEMRSLARLASADVLSRQREPEAALRLLAENGGRIARWTLLGPYGRIPPLALERRFPPEAGDFDPADDPPGEGGRRAHRVDASFADGRIFFPPSLRGNGAVYAVTDVLLGREFSGRLRVNSPVSFVLFIDGGRALSIDRLEQRPPDAVSLTVRLGPGRHRLLLKLAAGDRVPAVSVALEPETARMALRSVAPQGSPEGESSLTLERDAVDEWARSDQPRTAAEMLAAAWWLKSRGLERDAGAWLHRAAERWPRSALAALLLGEFYLRAETGASPAEDLAQGRALIDRALELDGSLVVARLLLAQMERTAGREEEAWQQARAALETSPGQPDVLLMLYQLSMQRRWLPEAGEYMERARAAAPGRSDVLSLAMDYCRSRGDHELLRELVAEQHARYPLEEDWAALLHAAGETEAALAAWDELLEIRPTLASAWIGRVRTLVDAGRVAEALETIDRAAEFFPADGWLHAERAGLLERLGREEQATAELERTLAEDPQRVRLHEILTRRGRPELMEPWLTDPASILARARRPGPDTDSALLADIAVTRIDADAGQTELYQGVHAVYTRAGVEHEGELRVLPDAIVRSIEIRKPDGQVIDVAAGQRRPIHLPGLEPGDAIDYVWLRYTPPLDALPGALDNRSVFLFQGDDRDYVLSRYVVQHDANLPVEACGNFEGLERTDEVIDGMRIRSWTAREMPRQYVEPHVPSRFEITPHVRLGLGLSWEAIGDLYRGALIGKLRLDDPLPGMLSEIRRRAGDGGPEAQARALHAVVQERVRPGASTLMLTTPASMAASAGEGDRSAIALALAQALGLRADLVLARPVELKGTQLDCPSVLAFPYVMLRIDLDGKQVFLDYNEADHPFDTLTARLWGSDALLVPLSGEEPARVIELPAREPRVLQEQVAQLEMGSDGKVSGDLRLVLRGAFASVTRRMLREVPRDKLPQVYQSLAGEVFPGAHVDDAAIEGRDDTEGDLVVSLRIRGGLLGRPTGSGLALGVTTQPLGLLPEYGSLPARQYPLLFAMPAFRLDRTEIRLPRGAGKADLPAGLDYDGVYGRYRLAVERREGVLLIERRALFPPRRVEAEQYIAFRDFAREVDGAEKAEVRVSLAP